jgi:putative ABC transport system permease protein
MPIWEAVTMALRTIWVQKLKSFFSLIGVLIGVMFLIAVVSIVQGMNVYMEDQFANRLIGLNTFQVRQRPSISTGDVPREVWLAWRRRPRITYADAEYLKERVTTPARMAMFCSDRMALSYDGKKAKDIDLVGTEAAYFQIKNYDVVNGRLLRAGIRAGRTVVVLGDLVAEQLFPAWTRGQDVIIAGLPYRIVGVVAKQGNLFGFSMDKFAVMPTRTGRRYIARSTPGRPAGSNG